MSGVCVAAGRQHNRGEEQRDITEWRVKAPEQQAKRGGGHHQGGRGSRATEAPGMRPVLAGAAPSMLQAGVKWGLKAGKVSTQ